MNSEASLPSILQEIDIKQIVLGSSSASVLHEVDISTEELHTGQDGYSSKDDILSISDSGILRSVYSPEMTVYRGILD